MLLHDAGADQQPCDRQIEHEAPVLLDRRGTVGRHKDGDHGDGINLVLLTAEIQHAEGPHRDAPAADPGPGGEQGEAERHVLGMEEVACGFLERGPERDRRRQCDRQPWGLDPLGRENGPEEEVGGGSRGRQPGGRKDEEDRGTRPEFLDRGQHDEDRLEVDAEEVRTGEARVKPLALGDVPDHLLVVREVPGLAGHAVEPLQVAMKRPRESDRGGQQRHGREHPPRLRGRLRSLRPSDLKGIHTHRQPSLSRDNPPDGPSGGRRYPARLGDRSRLQRSR